MSFSLTAPTIALMEMNPSCRRCKDLAAFRRHLRSLRGPRNDLKCLRKALNAYGITDEEMVILTDCRTDELVRERNFHFIGRSTKVVVMKGRLKLTQNCVSRDKILLYFPGHSSQVIEGKWGPGAFFPTKEDRKNKSIQLNDYRRNTIGTVARDLL